MCPATELPPNMTLTSPPRMATVAGPPPLNGTCKRSMPARDFSISITRWCWLPLPIEA
jgi:hypothetical protein